MSFFQQLDISVILFVQEHVRSGLLTPVMVFISTIGSGGLVWIAGGALLLVFKKTRYCGFALLLCLGLSWVINDMLFKPLIHRPRPYVTLSELQVLIPLRADFSFPSGHTATSFASAYAVTRTLGRRWAWVYVIAVLMAFSRLYLGMHYPSDILGGAVIGTLSALLICLLAEKYLKPRLQAKQNS